MPLRFKKLIENESSALAGEEKALCAHFLSGSNPFGVPENKNPRPASEVFDYIEPITLQSHQGRVKVLPIEGFRWATAPAEAGRTFLSSGTTAARRSQAPFSPHGLTLYKLNALYTFDWLMRELMGEAWAEGCGFSLIPPSSEWPDSSLAQMLSWIGELTKVEHIQPDDLPTVFASSLTKPVWLFGTGYHFINAMANTAGVKLPSGSVLIETGGTKGLAVDMPRPEYLTALSEHFGVAVHRIVSEYGMCELASQAYDWCREDTPVDARTFRFPRWVNCAVETASGALMPEGDGCLVIDDAFRIDLALPIRTQDFVAVHRDGGFSFCGRLVGAPLKGCSLRAIETQPRQPGKAAHTANRLGKTNTASVMPTIEKIEAFDHKLRAFLADAETIRALGLETGSSCDAHWVLAQTLASLPESGAAWMRALARSTNGNQPLATAWLYITPNSHSLAMLYPLSFAYLLGYTVHLRFPAPGKQKPFLLLTYAFFKSLGFQGLNKLEYKFRLGVDQEPAGCNGIFCFANDETLRQLHELTNLPIQGFGSSLAVTLLSLKEAAGASLGVVHDAFSLGQQGCVNTRFVILRGSGSADDRPNFELFATAVQRDFLRYWGGPLTEREGLALRHEKLRYERETKAFIPHGFHARGPLLVCFDETYLRSQQLLSAVPFVLPCYVVKNLQQHDSEILQIFKDGFNELKHVYANATYQNIPDGLRCNTIGHAQQLRWDGTHDGKMLFA